MEDEISDTPLRRYAPSHQAAAVNDQIPLSVGFACRRDDLSRWYVNQQVLRLQLVVDSGVALQMQHATRGIR